MTKRDCEIDATMISFLGSVMRRLRNSNWPWRIFPREREIVGSSVENTVKFSNTVVDVNLV